MQISNINTKNNFQANGCNYNKNHCSICNHNCQNANQNFDYLINELNSEDAKNMSPMAYFLMTTGLAGVSFLATKKASLFTIKGLEGKFPLFKVLDKLGNKLNSKLDHIKNKYPKIEVTGMKTFVRNSIHKISTSVNDFGKKGLSQEEIDAYKKLYKTDDIAPLEAKNAIRKTLASIFGIGTTSATIINRNKDEDKNGIPDKAERTQTTTKELIKTLPALLTATSEIV